MAIKSIGTRIVGIIVRTAIIVTETHTPDRGRPAGRPEAVRPGGLAGLAARSEHGERVSEGGDVG